jgi:SecD/SecF fusion protein
MTLPGIAGLILTIGVAADSNVVIFERIKEEARSGRSLSSAMAVGYRRGIATIIDANVITLLTAFILFVLATGGVKGFAFMLGVGTIVSLLTAVVFTQALLGTFGRGRLLRIGGRVEEGGEGPRWHFDFTGLSRWFFSISGVILIFGALSLATNQLNLGIDFESGTRITVGLEEAVDEDQIRDTLSGVGVEDAEIQEVDNRTLGDNGFQIQSRELQPEQVVGAQRALEQDFGIERGAFENTTVGPTFGEQIARSAIQAIIFSLLLIAAYVAFRFEPKYALPVMIAVAHDILITAGVYSLADREVTSATVAAFLTILGYSLYDTIIVFDRIRENVPRMPRATFSQIVNRSMSEVLTRSLITGLSAVFLVGMLLAFGGATLKDFAFAMMVGIASGTYSSIFIASPVLTAWKEREAGYQRRRARIESTIGAVPAFADDMDVAKVGPDEEEEGDGEVPVAPPAPAGPTPPRAAPEPKAQPEPALEGDGAGDAEPDSEQLVGASAERRRERNAKRRRQRARRRKHGRHR